MTTYSSFYQWGLCLIVAVGLHSLLLLDIPYQESQGQAKASGIGGVEIGIAQFKAASVIAPEVKPPEPRTQPKTEPKKTHPKAPPPKAPIKAKKLTTAIAPEPVVDKLPETPKKETPPDTGDYQQEKHQGEAAQNSAGGSKVQHDVHIQYQSLLQAKLAKNKKYPSRARRRGIQGEGKLRFIVNRNGSVQSFEIIESSGHSMLDKAIINMLKNAQPFAPFPIEIDEENMEFTIPVGFNLK